MQEWVEIRKFGVVFLGVRGRMLEMSGERLLRFCSVNELMITNTWYPHKDIHTVRVKKKFMFYGCSNARMLTRIISVRFASYPRTYPVHTSRTRWQTTAKLRVS